MVGKVPGRVSEDSIRPAVGCMLVTQIISQSQESMPATTRVKLAKFDGMWKLLSGRNVCIKSFFVFVFVFFLPTEGVCTCADFFCHSPK